LITLRGVILNIFVPHLLLFVMHMTAKMQVVCGRRTRRRSVVRCRTRGHPVVTLMLHWTWQTVLRSRFNLTLPHHTVPLKLPLLLRFGFQSFV